jgi:hypothetical protein
MTGGAETEALDRFAAGRALTALEVDPEATPLSGHSLDLSRTYSGKLTDRIDGWVGCFTYVTRSDDHSVTHHLTVAGTTIAESIGFAPYLAYREAAQAPGEVRQVKLEGSGLLISAYAGVSDVWLGQLFSPSLIDWLSRGADDFAFQLSDGELCTLRRSHLAEAELGQLCEDTAFLAGAVRAESIESSESGTTASAAAHHEQTDEDVWMENALAAVELAKPPGDVAEAAPAFAGVIRRNPATLVYLLWISLVVALAINVPAIVIPILLVSGREFGLLIGVEAALLVLVYFFVARSHVRKNSARAAAEAYFRSYAERHTMTLEDPLAFSATHAEAKLPFAPERVLTGVFADVGEASLFWKGDGSKREDRIGLVAGPRGPVASAELRAEPPGLGDEELDAYAASLAAELGSAKDARLAAPAQ